ncbi:hypothetical protein [Nonomuraea sp. NPDC023979]|uniref:hypothetical protein n=1 Tax=Nonomuraea sp. NPDC023979 TaxID=3154796 RepID=UPI0033E5D8F3
MPIIVSREKQPDNTIRTENIYKPIPYLDQVPRFLASEAAIRQLDAYKALVSEYKAFKAEYDQTINPAHESRAKTADQAAARKAVEAGKPVKDPTKHADEYRSKAAVYAVRHEVWLEKLIEAEKLVEAEISKPGNDALIERALEIAEERAVKYREHTSAMLEARDHYRESLTAVRWAVAQSAGDADTTPTVPAGKIPPPPRREREEINVTAILGDSERHKDRLDVLVGTGYRNVTNAALRFMYARLKDNPAYNRDEEPSGSYKDRFFTE